MSAIAMFSFENAQVRTLGTADTPLFVAIDIANALGYQNPIRSVNDHVDPEDITRQEILDNLGRKQTVNCVNESGLYALIFGSKLESAKRFKRWVTTEVLPAIRKTGQYQCPAAPAQYLTVEHQYAIQSAVGKRAKGQGAHYQTIYRALKARFNVPKYTFILDRDFDAAVEFIRTCELRVPEAPKAVVLPPAAPKEYVITERLVEQLRTFVYCQRYLFRESFDRYYAHLKSVDSPHAAMFWEAAHDLHLAALEASLAKIGFPVKELDCYKHWALTHSPA